MQICVVGTGYVGLVVGVCMADLGFSVTCADRDAEKIALLRAGGVPIYEPGLQPILARGTREGRLHFTTETSAAIAGADVVYIAVGTPGLADGSADISGVLAVAGLIADHMTSRTLVVIKSTVPVGTADKVRARIDETAKHPFDVVSNPEFLKEGAAVDDFSRPDRIVVGCATEWAADQMRTLYAGLVRSGRPIFVMDNRSAEITKYASNAMLATKISFMNELSRVCEAVGADIELVRRGVGSDTRIGPRFLFAGAGYGGSCFPKDVRALVDFAEAAGVPLRIARAVEVVNTDQKKVLASKVVARFGVDLSGRHFAIWGLAFKPQTDDMREAPSLVLIEELLARGATVAAYDPEATETARAVLGDRIRYASAAADALTGACALVVVTEWNEFRNPDLDRLKTGLSERVVFDGRNIYDPSKMRAAGLEYLAIGRP
ncbi:MAG: UDP-glucose 6-dehydrogenase [Deltaproteobacteria bacterium]|nr:UDP-glucose 6-dehydrogenase [Deltaproteobacteria bacterium]HCH66834.1 UDP-glucose 6-dehydrogenase [Deltaproteobacteria bacterium]